MKKYRGKEYLIDFIEMLGEKAVDSIQFVNVLKEVDELHDQTSRDYTSLATYYIDRLKRIGDGIFTVEKNKNDRRYLTIKVASKKELLERVDEFYQKGEKKDKVVEITKENRDLIVHAAKQIEKAKNISRQRAVQIAKKRITDVDKSKYIKVLKLALSKGDGFVEAVEIQAVIGNKNPVGYVYIKNMVDRINMFYEPKVVISKADSLHDGRSWAVKFNTSGLNITIAALGGDSVKKTSSVVKRDVKMNKPSKENTMLFIVAGLLKSAQYEYKDPNKICEVLRANSYYEYSCVTPNDILNLTNEYPEYFERSHNRKEILLTTDAFRKIKGEYSPALTEWNVIMCVNSGLSLDTVRRYFEKSYEERPDTKGSKIFIVKATRGIESLYKLAMIHSLMHTEDYFIGMSEADCHMIEKEYQKVVESIVTVPYLRKPVIFESRGDLVQCNDMKLFEIENI